MYNRTPREHRLKVLPATTPVAPDLANNLPVRRDPIIGRIEELAAARQILLRDEVDLLTLTGAGGIGKTRLGSQLAYELLDRFRDGVFFINLAPSPTPPDWSLLLPKPCNSKKRLPSHWIGLHQFYAVKGTGSTRARCARRESKRHRP